MRVGFIGLGAMGRHMARHLQEAGHDMTVHDLRREPLEALENLGVLGPGKTGPGHGARGVAANKAESGVTGARYESSCG